jgi:hypothetical protein
MYENGKNETWLKLFQKWRWEDKGEWWRGEFNYDIL